KEVIYDHKWSVQFSVTIKNSKTGVSALDKALKSYDTGKFTGSNLTAEKKAMNKSIKAAKAALEGKNNIGSYLCFSNKSLASYVKKHYSNYKIIGDTIFYRAE
ncbi:MAG: cell wall hydrolase, partial [Herbinix sp.]|nr:cell wall hydrolase [Herbinix sp.]